MKIDADALTKSIATKVANLLLPKIVKITRRTVKEEMQSSMKDLIFELYKNGELAPTSKKGKSISEVIDDDDEDEYHAPPKRKNKGVSKAGRAKAKNIMDNYYASNGSSAPGDLNELIMNSRSPEEISMDESNAYTTSNEMVDAKDLDDSDFVDPTMIDFSSQLEDIDQNVKERRGML